MMKGLEHVSCEGRLSELELLSLEKGNLNKCLKGEFKKDAASGATTQWCPVRGPEALGTNEAREVPSEHQETLFHCEGVQALAQVIQGGC